MSLTHCYLEADLVEVFEPFFAEFEDLGEVDGELHFVAGDGEDVQGPDGEAGIVRDEIEGLEPGDGKKVSEGLVLVFLGQLSGGEVGDVVLGVGAFDLDGMGEVGGGTVGGDADVRQLVGGDETEVVDGVACLEAIGFPGEGLEVDAALHGGRDPGFVPGLGYLFCDEFVDEGEVVG